MALAKAEKIKKNEIGYDPPVEVFEAPFGLSFEKPLNLTNHFTDFIKTI
jgi:hypothetical protein